MRNDLIGFLLGALDDWEHEEVARQLEVDARERSDLQLLHSGLDVLDDRGLTEAPVGLASRTLEFVDRHCQAEKGSERSVPRAAPAPVSAWSASSEPPVGMSIWSTADVFVTAGICLAIAMMFFPALSQSRSQARIQACSFNLSQLGVALHQYAQYSGGLLPAPHSSEKFHVAGIYAPLLKERDLVPDERVFQCPASESGPAAWSAFRVPDLQEVALADGEDLVRLQRVMGGSYAYSLSFVRDGRLQPIRNLRRSHYVVMADAPRQRRLGDAFVHPRGWNMLFEDGRVAFVTTPECGPYGDNVFCSNRGLVEAGRDSYDIVLGASAARP